MFGRFCCYYREGLLRGRWDHPPARLTGPPPTAAGTGFVSGVLPAMAAPATGSGALSAGAAAKVTQYFGAPSAAAEEVPQATLGATPSLRERESSPPWAKSRRQGCPLWPTGRASTPSRKSSPRTFQRGACGCISGVPAAISPRDEADWVCVLPKTGDKSHRGRPLLLPSAYSRGHDDPRALADPRGLHREVAQV